MSWTTAPTYLELKKFLKSSLFYVFLGIIFLVASHLLQYAVQSAFLFLIAILGVALLLYGTGTQAIGSSDSTKIKVSMAGGAGVLALILGYAIVEKRKEIREVFKYTPEYGILTITNEDVKNLDFEKDYDVIAESRSGAKLPLWRKLKTIEIVVRLDEYENESWVVLRLTPKGPPAQDRDDRDDKRFRVVWDATKNEGSVNEKIRRDTQTMPLLVLPKIQTQTGAPITVQAQ